MKTYNEFQLEMSKIFGQHVDARKPYPEFISDICEVDTAESNEYHYYFDVLVDTDKVYTISTGGITQINVSPDTPAELTFTSLVSPEYYIKLPDLTSAKERVVSRKIQTINRAMNANESATVIDLMHDACITNSRTQTLGSGVTTFNYNHLITMMNEVIDYGSSFSLVMGTTIDRDIRLWDWNDNKYASMVAAWKDLNLTTHRINQTVSIDGSSTSALSATQAYLVAKDTEMGKPLLFVRKKLDDIEWLGGSIMKDGDKPQRIVFVSPNPVTVTSVARYLAVACTGFEEIAAAVKNYYAIYRFNRVT